MSFADSIHALADAHWVQTPYRYFPIEPHWVAPRTQFLPAALRSRMAYKWPLAHTPASSLAEARDAVLWTELIDKTQMRHYFPQSTIRSERIAGLTKSLIAYKLPGS